MKLTPLLERFDSVPSLARLAQKLGQVQDPQFESVIEGARPALAAYLSQRLGGSLVYVTSHPHRAEHVAGELSPWLELPVELVPAFEALPYERAASDKDILARRQGVVNRLLAEPAAVVVSVRALLQPVSLPDPAVKAVIELRTGATVVVDALLQTLVSGGYEAAPLVEDVGTFTRRGGILDVFPVGGSHPVRIELLGNKIDSLRIFDPTSQRTLDQIVSATFAPMQSVSLETMQAAAAQLKDLSIENLEPAARIRWATDLEQLEAGEVDNPQFFAPYLNAGATLIDAAHARREGKPLVIFEDPDDIRLTAGDLVAKAREIQTELEERGDLPRGLRPGLLEMDLIESSLQDAAILEFGHGGDEQTLEDRVFARPAAFGGRVRNFVHALDPFAQDAESRSGYFSTSPLESALTDTLPSTVGSEGHRPESVVHAAANALVVTSFQHGRLAEMLLAENLPVTVVDSLEVVPAAGTISIVKGSLAEGWVAPALGIELYTDHEIFGWSKPRATTRRRRAARDTFFTDFTNGDYVVHIEHGIGQLVGTTKKPDSGVDKEYLILKYAGTDRLYVPTDQLDRVTRYVGMGEAKPHLNKLGGQEWIRAKAKAKQAAEDMAEELIGLYARREAAGGHAFMPDTPWQRELEGSFPFEETPDQMQAIIDVKADMERERAMDRLVVADVGYGKTEVAVRAAFKAVMDGVQVAVLVPTTVLGQQHVETFRERLEAFPIRIDVLSRFRSPKEQRDVLNRLAEGEVDVIIGTHRLLGKDVRFKDLGLLVVDEEQRFGVRHKERLKQMRATVDVLTLTATPIPRTLHMSLTGIRDVSIIQTPPEGRLPIRTYLQPYEDRLIREAIVREIEREGQVYFVHNRVAGIEAVAEKLRRLVPEARVLVGHGQMPEDQLEKVMLDFAHDKADVLLCSTIIESGLDIPNVNTIVIDHAEALGLAQMYQLRGRVGRGVNQAYAYLLYPRDARIGKDAMRRMEAVFEATELGAGFQIAMTDLEIRGAGNLLGAAQSGNLAAIGFDLYTSLLKDAIERMRGQPALEAPHVTVDLPFDVLIPESYVQDERERLSLYRRLATVTSPAALTAFEDEIRDRFGALPRTVANLVNQTAIKFLATDAHVSSVSLRGDRLTIKGERRILFDRVALYKRFGTAARIDENVLRIEARALEPDWLQSIRDVLTDTAALRERQLNAVAASL